MKKIFMLILAVGFCFQLNTTIAQTASSQSGPKMKLESMTVDYGTIQKNGEPLKTVKFTNTGTEPLIIKSATGNCGCTVPTWPREAIMPGASEEIKIRYATDRIGQINKKVTITTNENTDNVHVIDVKGNVLPDESDIQNESHPNLIVPKSK